MLATPIPLTAPSRHIYSPEPLAFWVRRTCAADGERRNAQFFWYSGLSE
jgi:hypothetical protein